MDQQPRFGSRSSRHDLAEMNTPCACCYEMTRPLPWTDRVILTWLAYLIRRCGRERLRNVMLGPVPFPRHERWQWMGVHRLRRAMLWGVMMHYRQAALTTWWRKMP